MNATPQSGSRTKGKIALFVLAVLCGSVWWLLRDARLTSRTTPAPPQPPTIVITQLVAGGPLIVVSENSDGSLVTITQFVMPQLSIRLPDRYYIEGGRGSEAGGFSRFGRMQNTVGLTLLDDTKGEE